MASRSLSLYRSFFREAARFSDYNFRSYALRRVQTGFRENMTLSGDAAESAYQDGVSQLTSLRRMVAVSEIYTPPSPSVMDVVAGGQPQ